MPEEPDPERHHIFFESDGGYTAAYEFYNGMKKDNSLSEELRDEIKPPRQGLRGTWLINKVK